MVLLHGGIQCGGVYWAPVLARLARRQDPAWFAAFLAYMVSRGGVPHIEQPDAFVVHALGEA